VPAKFYLTTAIDYANGSPHLGHALEKIQADCVARYRRLRGDRVRFLTGMDEHSQNVPHAAEDAALTPQAWVDRIAGEFLDAWRGLHISHDDFIRTTEARHERGVLALLRRIRATQPDDIYEGTYTGYYCASCEAYKLERELEDGHCPIHPTLEIQWLEERNLFFRLSRYAERLLAHYDAHPTFVVPPAKMNEVRNIVAGGLQDVSISRSRLPWGIPFPDQDGYTVYVWFDALINYLSATGFPEQDYADWWPADLHIIGPDIIRFHAVMWPAMLMAADLPVPGRVWSHGWLLTTGGRFSKTAGVRVTLEEAVARHGADALRFYLLSAVPWNGDGEFGWDLFDSAYVATLANNIGNLASRTLAMMHRYVEGTVPAADDPASLDQAHITLIGQYAAALDGLRLNEGATILAQMGSAANEFVDRQAPWKLVKEGRASEAGATLAALHRALVRIAVLAFPYAPEKAQELFGALGGSGEVGAFPWRDLGHPATAGWNTSSAITLFPKPERAS
jgi:methionyl-tRNA synthetase